MPCSWTSLGHLASAQPRPHHLAVHPFRKRWFALVVIVGASFPLVRARAEPGPVTERYRLELERAGVAETCLDAETLEAEVSARLGYEPFDAYASRKIRVLVRTAHGALESRIAMVDGTGKLTAERTLRSAKGDCGEMTGAVGLAISIALDPLQDRAAPAPNVAPLSGEASALPAARVEPAVVAVSPAMSPSAATMGSASVGTVQTVATPAAPSRPSPPMAIELGFGPVAALGVAPTPSVGAALGVGARRENLSLSLEGRADWPAVEKASSGEIRASILAASLAPCRHVRFVAFCGLFTGGVLRAAGQGLDDERQVTLPYFAIGGRVLVGLPLGPRWALLAHVDLSASLVETELQVGHQPVWTSPPLSFASGLRFNVRLP